MRSYRESFAHEGRRRGLTQEALLERMRSVDSNYAERYSHATVSRWESSGTRPTLQQLKVFGQALSLSQTDVAATRCPLPAPSLTAPQPVSRA